MVLAVSGAAWLLRSVGEAEESRALLSQALSQARGRDRRDGYWDYLQRNAARFEALFDALRRETLQ